MSGCLERTLLPEHVRKQLSQDNGGEGDQEQSQAGDEEMLEGWLRQAPTGYRQSPAEEGGLHGQGVSRLLGPQSREVPG